MFPFVVRLGKVVSMNGRKFIIYNLLFLTFHEIVTGHVFNVSLAKNFQNNEQIFTVIPGINLYSKQGEFGIQVSFRDFFSENVSVGRGSGAGAGGGGGNGPAAAGGSGGAGGGAAKRTGPLQKIIRAMMMIPLAMQIITLPGVLAEIKISLLRSLIVAKVALFMLISNAIRSSQNKEVVVIQKLPPPQHHDHFYHPDSSEFEDDNHLFGR